MSMVFVNFDFAEVEESAKFGGRRTELLNDFYERFSGGRPKRITKKLNRAVMEELAKVAEANGVEYEVDDDGASIDTTLYFHDDSVPAQQVFELVADLSCAAIGNALVRVYGDAPAVVAA